jgi:hypothetical protein
MAEFLHIYVKQRADVTRAEVEKKLSLAVDWFRYDSKIYVVYTTSNVDKWQERLIDLVKPSGHLFICRLDIKVRQGWMPKKFWTWLRSKAEVMKS